MLPYFLAHSSAFEKDKLDNFMRYFQGHIKILSLSRGTQELSTFPDSKPRQVVQHIFKAAL